MRALFVILGAVVMLVGVATQPASAEPATDYEKFIKRVEKFVMPNIGDNAFSLKPRGLCVCQDGGADNGLAGVLLHQDLNAGHDVQVGCWVRTFGLTGEDSGASRCDTFEVLSK